MSAKLTTQSPLMSQFCQGQFGYCACQAGRLPRAFTNGLISAKLMKPSQFVSPRQGVLTVSVRRSLSTAPQCQIFTR